MKTIKILGVFAGLLALSGQAQAGLASGSCTETIVDGQGHVVGTAELALRPTNPEGHYGMVLQGGLDQFDVRAILNICPADQPCDLARLGDPGTVLSLTITHVDTVTQKSISGPDFVAGKTLSASLPTAAGTLSCSVNKN